VYIAIATAGRNSASSTPITPRMMPVRRCWLHDLKILFHKAFYEEPWALCKVEYNPSMIDAMSRFSP